jgi:hypothetical protein
MVVAGDLFSEQTTRDELRHAVADWKRCSGRFYCAAAPSWP